jgi:hypothetical protein
MRIINNVRTKAAISAPASLGVADFVGTAGSARERDLSEEAGALYFFIFRLSFKIDCATQSHGRRLIPPPRWRQKDIIITLLRSEHSADALPPGTIRHFSVVDFFCHGEVSIANHSFLYYHTHETKRHGGFQPVLDIIPFANDNR